MKAGATTLDNPHFQKGNEHLKSAKKITEEKVGYKTAVAANNSTAINSAVQSLDTDKNLQLLFGDDMTPSITDIKQGEKINDCWVLSSLGTIVSKNPQFIRDNISIISNGHYQVILYDINNIPKKIDVYEKDILERSWYKIKKNFPSEKWVDIYEAALRKEFDDNYGDYRGKFLNNFTQNNTNTGKASVIGISTASDTAFELKDERTMGKVGVLNYNNPAIALQMFTGDNVIILDNNNFDKLLSNNQSEYNYSVAEVMENADDKSDKSFIVLEDTDYKLSYNHAYPILRTEGDNVILQNPWGVNYNRNGKEIGGGELKISKREFKQYFHAVYVTKNK